MQVEPNVGERQGAREPVEREGVRLKVERFALAAWLLLATLAVSNSRYSLLLPLPWCLLLVRWRASIVSLAEIWRHWQVPALASLALALWLALGAGFGPPAPQSRLPLAATAVLWIPVATLIASQRRAGHRIEGLLAAMLLSVIALNALRVGHQLLAGAIRPSGYTHNVLVGPYMIALALAAATLLLQSRVPVQRLMAGAALGLAFAVGIALASRARTPLVVSGVVLLAITVAWRFKPSRAIWIALTILFVAWIAWTSDRWQVFVDQSVDYNTTTHKTSVGARVDMLRWAVHHVDEIPLLGYGESGLAERMNRRYLEFGIAPDQVYELLHMHNDVLQLSFAHGLVAGVCYAIFLLALIHGLYRRRHACNGNARIPDLGSATAAAAVLVLATTGLFDCFLYWPKVWVALQSVFAIAIALHASEPPPRREPTQSAARNS